MKSAIYVLIALSLAAPSVAATGAPEHARKPAVKKKATVAKDEKEQEIDKSIAELNTLLRDSRMNPRSGSPALLEDFKEDLALEQKQATLSTDDLAKDRGLQGDLPASAATELE